MEIEQKYERKMRALRDELDLRRKTELHEVEERKNAQINTLMRNHEKAFSDIKNYYNDITLNNLALINTLKVAVCTLMLMEHYTVHYYLRRRLASREGIVSLGVMLSCCVCVCVRQAAYITSFLSDIFITFAATWQAEKVLCHSASVCHAIALCVCVRRISLGGEGNVLYPMLSGYCFTATTFNCCLTGHFL